jgi:hypothetical protein
MISSARAKLLKGKRGLIVGITNDQPLWRRLTEGCHWITQKITQSLSNDRSLASS